MQVADRFHLHQNLLEAIKKALNKEIPATITIPHADEDVCKKIAVDVDKVIFMRKRLVICWNARVVGHI